MFICEIDSKVLYIPGCSFKLILFHVAAALNTLPVLLDLLEFTLPK